MNEMKEMTGQMAQMKSQMAQMENQIKQMSKMNYMPQSGRNGIWTPEMWQRIDQAVHDEHHLTEIAAKFLPLYPVGEEDKTVPFDGVNLNMLPLLTINEQAVVPIQEISVEFALTRAQFEDPNLTAATALAIDAANILARAKDSIIFNGSGALKDDMFRAKMVKLLGARENKDNGEIETEGNPVVGLLSYVQEDQRLTVEPTEVNSEDPIQNKYGENSFSVAARGYALLQRTQYGRQALVLCTTAYADTFAALPDTLIMPENRIRGLIGEHYYGSSTLCIGCDKTATSKGVLVAIDGNTMDLVVGRDASTEYITQDGPLFRFRVVERFALRLKDPRAVVELTFLPDKSSSARSSKKDA